MPPSKDEKPLGRKAYGSIGPSAYQSPRSRGP